MTPRGLGRGTLAGAAAIAAVLAIGTASAQARTTVRAALVHSGTTTTLQVRIISTRAFTARNRPRHVTVVVPGRTYRLLHVSDRRRASTWRSTWSTGHRHGAQAAALDELAGGRATVVVRSRGGKRMPHVQVDGPPNWPPGQIKHDTTPPETTLTGRPDAVTTDTGARFTFTSSEPDSTFVCSLDGGVARSCTSPQWYGGLAAGPHTFSVAAIDMADNVDPTPATYAWTVVVPDRTPPETTITAHPASPTSSTSATFAFSSSEPGSTFACTLDGHGVSCAQPLTGLEDGSHTFTVAATDAANNTDPTPASYTWTVDTTAPDTFLDTKPGALTNDNSATFTFHGSDADATFTCTLDGHAISCAQPLTKLDDGSHTFTVAASDRVGNVDPSPASYTWTVDTTAPDTKLDTTPDKLTNATSATFTYHAVPTGDVASYLCTLDGKTVGCGDPISGLDDGSHTFTVAAKDAAGNVDPTPDSYTWTVDTTPPETQLDSTPDASTSSTDATFTYHGTPADDVASYVCTLDGKDIACGDPITGLADGSHTFTVAAKDAAGNVDATPASFTWTVTTNAPPPDGGVYVAPDGTGTACTQAQPCGSFQAGFDAAQAGGVVTIAGGTYPPQQVNGDKGSPDNVVFRAADGAKVKVGTSEGDCSQGLDIWASHVTFEDLSDVGDTCLVGNAESLGKVTQSDVTLRNIHASSLVVDSVDHVRVLGGEYGGTPEHPSANNSRIQQAGSTPPTDVVIDGAKFHDYACAEGDSECHIECLIVGAANNLTVRNSQFYDCAIMDMFFETFNGPISHVTIENNVMADATELYGGPGTGRPSVFFKGNSSFDDVLVRYNSARGGIEFEPSEPDQQLTNVRVLANISSLQSCNRDVYYAFNVWDSNQVCGALDMSAPPKPDDPNQEPSVDTLWVTPTSDATMDYHLVKDAPVIDWIPDMDGILDPAIAQDLKIGTDIDGQTRPIGDAREPGADEFSGS